MSRLAVIAIVDDDRGVRDALCDLLLAEGFCPHPFASADLFLASASPADYDAIITDVRMPGIDGLAFQARLRAEGHAIPMVFITSSAHDATRTRALQEGALVWFTKPVAGDALIDLLRATISGAP